MVSVAEVLTMEELAATAEESAAVAVVVAALTVTGSCDCYLL